MTLEDLMTPALLLDHARLLANVEAMTQRMQRLGVLLRPHMKTCKSIDVGRLALGGNFGGISVSTLREAQYFRGHGITDITYAVGIAPGKLDHVAGLRAAGLDLSVITDHVEGARAIAEHGGDFSALIEIDCGSGRGGVLPGGSELLEIARMIDSAPTVNLRGVLTNSGHSYEGRSAAEFEASAEEERLAVVLAADRLREAGLPCPVVSLGSTPTALFARDLTGVTEARPGIYMFQDLFRAGIGLCRMEDIAVSVLASVIGHRPADNQVLVDAGAIALSQDRSTSRLDGGDAGYGLVMDRDLQPIVPGLMVSRVHTEHGWVTAEASLPFDSLPIGALVRILPNHGCHVPAQYDRYHVVDDKQCVIDEMAPV